MESSLVVQILLGDRDKLEKVFPEGYNISAIVGNRFSYVFEDGLIDNEVRKIKRKVKSLGGNVEFYI